MQTVLSDLPGWLVFGTLFGIALSGVVASVFLVGALVFPNRTQRGTVHSGDARRRTEIRQYLHAIDEPFAENHFVEGHTVAFYLPTRDVAITFDARAFYAIEESPTRAVLVEHEMPGIHLGSRLPFETPDRDFATNEGTEDDRVEAALAVLGLPSNASDQQVRDAYREKVKAVHPDLGGDPESFQRVKEAYATASERAD